MQVIKESTRTLLLATARSAFFQKGYEAVTMRELSRRSGVSLSNIYSYYRSKEDLLGAVLAPLISELDGLQEEYTIAETNSPGWFVSESYRKESVRRMVGVVVRYRQELRLLFSLGTSTRFQGYCDDWVNRSSARGEAYMRDIGRMYPHLHTNVSAEFLRFCSARWLQIMRRVVQRDGLTESDVERILDEFVEFNIGGWARLMRVKVEGTAAAVPVGGEE